MDKQKKKVLNIVQNRNLFSEMQEHPRLQSWDELVELKKI